MTMPMIDAVGYIAGALCTISFVPQILHIYRRRSARDLSLAMFLTFWCGVFLWLVYGLIKMDWPIILANLITFALASMILYLKFHFDRSERSSQSEKGFDRFSPAESITPSHSAKDPA